MQICIYILFVVFLGDDIPFNGRQCDARRHSWVIIVGTTAEYPTMDAFIHQRLMNVDVFEMPDSSSSDGIYFIEVNDPVEGKVTYLSH